MSVFFLSMNTEALINQISRGTLEIINLESLKAKLEKRKSLVIKAGFDPTAPDIHLGHVVLLRKLRQFQDLGHDVYFLIGDFTARIGDPTGRDQLRKSLTSKEIKDNAQTYKKQVSKILDPKKTKVVFNSQWFDKLTIPDLLSLTRHCSVAQMLARADFKKRMEENNEISFLEFMYPLLQGYDSVELKADIELGGSDQKFNLLMGRQIQEAYGQEPQVVIMTPLLEGLDGVKKMSKSFGNYIGINEAPKEIFGKIMSLSDELMYKYFEFLTDCDLSEVKAMHPKEAKMKLAAEIITQFYSESEAKAEKENFIKTFSLKEIPQDMETFKLEGNLTLAEILVDKKGIVSSRREFTRLVNEGAIKIDGEVLKDAGQKASKSVIKIGKRRFLRLV